LAIAKFILSNFYLK